MKPKHLNATDTGPWYREPWPWILMAGPVIVIIAGIITAWLAVVTNDGLVTDDYYKKGLAVNQTIARSDKAASLGLTAGIRMANEAVSVRLLATDKTFTPPPTLLVTISHPTRAGMDQSRTLTREGEVYVAPIRLPSAGHWLVLVEDDTHQWRLMGNLVLPANGEAMIGSTEPVAPTDLRK